VGTQTTLGLLAKKAPPGRDSDASAIDAMITVTTVHQLSLVFFTRFNVITDVRSGTVSSYINSVRSIASL